MKSIRRRDFLRISGMAAAASVLASCAPAQPPAPAAEANPTQPAAAAPTTAAAAPTTAAPAAQAPAAGEAEKVVIWITGDNGPVKDWKTDPILKEVETQTNTQIEMNMVGWDSFDTQLNSAVASGSVPDIFGVVDHTKKTQIQQWVDDGVVAAYDGPVAAAAPNVVAEYEKNKTLQEIKVNGKIYGQPIGWGDGNYPNMGLLHVRADLLEKYQMDAPQTFQQYFDFLRAAKKDGLQGVLFSAGGGIGPAINAFAGAYNTPMLGWVKKESKYEFWAIQPGIKDALILFRSMVGEGLVDPASWEDKEGKARDMYVAGQSASLIFNGGGHVGRIQNDMTLAGKGAKEMLLAALDAGKGSRGYTSEPMFWGLSFLGGMKGNHPEAAARVINFLISEAGYKLTAVGIEGVDYKVENNEIVMLPQRSKDGFPTESGDTGAHPLATGVVSWVPQQWQDWALLYGKDQAFKDWYKSMWANQGKYQIPTFGILTTTPQWTSFEQTGSELVTRTFLDAVKAGSEKETADLFDQFVKDWLAAGGEAAQAEMSDQLVKIYG